MFPEEVIITQNINTLLLDLSLETNYSNIAVLVDENTSQYCLPIIEKNLPDFQLIKINSGEENKTLDTCSFIWHELTRLKFDRKSLLINLGGGVIGDMGGFCASTYKRGIDFVNIPTTLLAQVDASVGGKLGIDFEGFKNHIGVFRKPDCVIIDSCFLNTLPEREIRSGFAEVIKHSLIADESYWEKLIQKDFYHQEWFDIIQHSVALKKNVVKKDPTEKNIRKILNFGHTIGHAIETYYLNKKENRLLHGEAIAIGMICETYLSSTILDLPESSVKEIEDYIIAQYGKSSIEKDEIKEIVELCSQDKKNENELINFSLLENIGNAVFNKFVEQDLITKAILKYREI